MVRSLECRRQRWANGWMDRGNILFLLCGLGLSYCSRWGRVSFMIQGPQPLDGWEQDMAIVTPPALVSQRTSNQTCMRRWQGRAGNFSPLALSASALCFHSLVSEKKKKKHLEEDCVSLVLGELKVEATALQKQELSSCFAYIIALKQISVCNTTTYKRRASCRSNYGGLAWRLIGGAMCLFQNLYLFKEGFRRVQTFLSSTALSRTP